MQKRRKKNKEGAAERIPPLLDFRGKAWYNKKKASGKGIGVEKLCEERDKRVLYREVLLLCLIFVLHLGLNTLLSQILVLTGLFETAELNPSGTALAIAQNRVQLVAYLGTYVATFALPLGIYLIVRHRDPDKGYFRLAPPNDWRLVFAGAMGALAVNYYFTMLSQASAIWSPLSSGDLIAVTGDPVSDLLVFLILVPAPALLEEACFRGVICGRIARYNGGVAVFVSALLFGMMHMNFGQIPFAFCVGLILGYVYLATGSFWGGVVIHAINNALAYVSLTVDFYTNSSRTASLIFIGCFAVLFLIGLGCLCAMALRPRRLGEQPRLSGKAAMGAAMANPLMILSLAVMLCGAFLGSAL